MNWAQFLRDAALGTATYMSVKTAEGINSLNEAFGDFQKRSEAQIESLRSDIKRGFAELSLELAVHSEIFNNILNVLQNKRKTEAEELKQFGLTALRNGWIDDAIRDLDKSLEINRYDYQVYYLLAKCYGLQDDADKQNKNLELSYHYSSDDPSFRLYLALDIVTILVDDGKFDDAKSVIQFIDGSINENVDKSPLYLAKVYVDVFSQDVNDSTMEAISRALESYQGDDPSRIMTIILALSQQCNNETRLKIENLFNLKRLKISQKYGKKVLTYLGNIDKFLSFTQQIGSIKNVNLTYAPSAVTGRFFPAFSKIKEIRKRIQGIINAGNSLSVDLFDKFVFLMPALNSLERRIIEDVQWANEPQPQRNSLNKNPYAQISSPTYNFTVGSNDKILIQVELGGALVTLTVFKIIIVDNEKKTYQYDIFEDYVNLSVPILNRSSTLGTAEDSVSFYIRDRITDKVLQVATSKMCSENYVINDRKANYLDLLTQRATSLLGGYLRMSLFNSHLELLNAYLDMLDADKNYVSKDGSADHFSEISTNNDIEFLD